MDIHTLNDSKGISKSSIKKLKYSCEEVYERMDSGMCIFCDEQDIPGHQQSMHKGIQILIVAEEDGAKTRAEEKFNLPLGQNFEYMKEKKEGKLYQKCSSMGKEDSGKKFTWVIENFSSLQSKNIYSDEFVAGGCKWRLLAFPKGNGVEFLSLYLDVASRGSLPVGWRRRAHMCLSVMNQLYCGLSEAKVTEHWFDARTPDWGFTSIIPLGKLHDKNGGFLVNDVLKIVADVDVLEVIGKLDVLEEATKSVSIVEEEEGVESSDCLKKASSIKESINVNGFQVLPSQVESVKSIFERHPDIASEFRPKNQHLKKAYINVLLSLIETLCQPTKELSEDDLTEAHASLEYLTEAGLSLDWLEDKLDEVDEKKKNEEASETRVQKIEKDLKDLKLKCLNLEAELEKEKANVSLARAPLSFDDVV